MGRVDMGKTHPGILRYVYKYSFEMSFRRQRLSQEYTFTLETKSFIISS